MAVFNVVLVVFFLWMVFTEERDEYIKKEPYYRPLWFRSWAPTLGPCNCWAYIAIFSFMYMWALVKFYVSCMETNACRCCRNVHVERHPERQVIREYSSVATNASSCQVPSSAPPQCGSHSQGSQMNRANEVADHGISTVQELRRSARIQAYKLAKQGMAAIPEPRRSARIQAYTIAKQMAAVQELQRTRKNRG